VISEVFPLSQTSSIHSNKLDHSFGVMILVHSWRYKFYYLGALICLTSLHLVQSEIPLMAKNLGELVYQGRSGEISWFQFLMVAVAVLFFRTLSRLLFFYPARVQQKDLRVELMERLENCHPQFYREKSDGDIFQIIYNDLNRLRGLVGFGFLQFGNVLIAAYIFLPKIYQFNPQFVVAFIPVLLCVIFFTISIYFFQPLVKKEMLYTGKIQNLIIESYQAKSTVKNFHAEHSIIELFKVRNRQQLAIFFKASLGRTFGVPLVKMGVGLSLLWAAMVVRNQGLPATDLIYFSGFLFLIQEPLMFLSWIGVVTGQGLAGWSRIKELVVMVKKQETQKLNQNLENDSYFHDDNEKISVQLKFWNESLPFDFYHHQWTIFLGDTGAGKSHLMEALANYLIDNNRSISFVHQEPFIYNDTVLKNIFLGRPPRDEDLQELKNLYFFFGLDSLAESFEDFLQIIVGENGKQLSGGQAKRVVLLRSLVSQADFILWDDPFSSVDYLMEKKIFLELKKSVLVKNKTFILSSHRLTTVNYCDSYYLLNKEKQNYLKGLVKEDLAQKDSALSEYFKKQMV
jgi:ABC-type multidrug transport system fused ATPase/permease subunit